MSTEKAVIFDFDGVIADSAPFYCERYRSTAEKFGKHFPVKNLDDFREWYDSSFENNYLNLGFTPDEMKEVRNYVRVVDTYSHIPVFPGIREVLEELASKYKVAIASCTAGKVIQDKLKEEGLDSFISFLSPGDAHGSDKKEIVSNVLKQFGIKAEDAIMVGDTQMDIISAHNNGIEAIGSVYGWHSEKKLKSAGCKYLAFKPSDILPFVDIIFNSNEG